MKRVKLTLIIGVVLLATLITATTYHWIDTSHGVSDFATDEKIADVGDGIWTSQLENVYLTWDADKLFIGMDFDNSGDNGYDVWIGTAEGSTCTDASGIGWSKRIGFSGWNPDYAIFTWPSSSSWEIDKIASNTSAENYGTTFTAKGGWVAVTNGTTGTVCIQFPWSAMGGFSTGQHVQVAFTLTGANWSAGDAVPDQTVGPNGGGANDILDLFYDINCDVDNNGVPDTGYSFSSQNVSLVKDWEFY